MTVPIYQLRWIPESIANLMHSNNIHGRADLAKRIGVSRSTVYSVFARDWSGTATTSVLAQLAGQFQVPLNTLVSEPGAQRPKRGNLLK